MDQTKLHIISDEKKELLDIIEKLPSRGNVKLVDEIDAETLVCCKDLYDLPEDIRSKISRVLLCDTEHFAEGLAGFPEILDRGFLKEFKHYSRFKLNRFTEAKSKLKSFVTETFLEDSLYIQDLYLGIDELLDNAFFNAPAASKDSPVALDKKQEKVLDDNEIRFNIIADKHRTVFNCIDPYGTLDGSAILSHIIKGPAGMIDTLSRKTGDRRIGLSLMFNNCDSMYFDIESGKKTSVYTVNNRKSKRYKLLIINRG